MNDKYYTPDINEFYESFEYEYKPWKHGGKDYDRLEWQKINNFNHLIYTDDINPIWELIEMIKNNWVRVKYLDITDIESLGFKWDPSHERYLELDGYQLYFYIIGMNDINSIERRITIYDNDTSDVIFKGVINNKSELKVLLKQLGININE